MSVWTPRQRPGHAGPLLLDTHVWIWMVEGNAARLPAALRPLIDRAAAHHHLHVSDISAWEVAQKAAGGKLGLTMPAPLWIERAMRAPGVSPLPVDRDVLVLSTAIDTAHRDPVDRMLIATAQLHGIPLVTADALMLEWGRREGKTPMCDVRV